jgi:hypothetical protein
VSPPGEFLPLPRAAGERVGVRGRSQFGVVSSCPVGRRTAS